MGRAARGGRWGFCDPPGLAAPNRAATGQNLPRGARRSFGAGLVTSDLPRGRGSGNATSWALEEELGVGGRGGAHWDADQFPGDSRRPADLNSGLRGVRPVKCPRWGRVPAQVLMSSLA